MTPAGERFGGHVLATVDMCGARRFFRDPELLAVPELAHRDLRDSEYVLVTDEEFVSSTSDRPWSRPTLPGGLERDR